jgi:hypothetical protein
MRGGGTPWRDPPSAARRFSTVLTHILRVEPEVAVRDHAGGRLQRLAEPLDSVAPELRELVEEQDP